MTKTYHYYFPNLAKAKPWPIENGLAIPPQKEGRPRKYPWLELQVGQSFPVECSLVDRKSVRASLRMCRLNMQRRHGLRFEIRVVLGGLRVWRVL